LGIPLNTRIAAKLKEMSERRARQSPPIAPSAGPGMALLLDVDRQYREQTQAGTLLSP